MNQKEGEAGDLERSCSVQIARDTLQLENPPLRSSGEQASSGAEQFAKAGRRKVFFQAY